MSYVTYTKTSTFLFPLLGISKNIFNCNVKSTFGKQIMTNRFLNSYMRDENLDNQEFNLGPYIFIIIKGFMDKDFESFHSTITGEYSYVDEYDRKEFKVMVFKIPDEYLHDYQLFKKGLYSKFSQPAKELIEQNAFFKTKGTLKKIFNKDSYLRQKWEERLSVTNSSLVDLGNQEVWTIYNLKKETFNIKLLEELSRQSKINPNKKEFK